MIGQNITISINDDPGSHAELFVVPVARSIPKEFAKARSSMNGTAARRGPFRR